MTTTGASKTYEYDANGNLRYEKQPNGTVIREYRWDQQNRLVRELHGTHESVYEYDGESRRVRIKELTSSVETKNEIFVWCGPRICQKRTGSTIVRSYFGDGFEAGTSDYFYTRDHLASVREVVGSDGTTIASRLSYDPWGNVSESGTVLSDFAYTGHHLDRATSLSLTHYRGYDPFLARWLSRDPIGLAGGLNLYGYVNNSPVSYLDPSGRGPWEFAKCLFAGRGWSACMEEEEERWDNSPFNPGGPPGGGMFPPVEPPGGPGRPGNDNGGGGGPGVGGAAGGGTKGTGGGARDHGICELKRQLTGLSCDGKPTTICQYYCPISKAWMTIEGPGGFCPPTIAFQSR